MKINQTFAFKLNIVSLLFAVFFAVVTIIGLLFDYWIIDYFFNGLLNFVSLGFYFMSWFELRNYRKHLSIITEDEI